MKKLIFIFTLISITFNTVAQELYSKAYGTPSDPPIIYLHGGPGYHSIGFEISTAEILAQKGFYVIVYDRRGEGRSMASNPNYNFKETFKDLNALYSKYKIEKATLVGHSFGGIIGTLFASQFSQKVKHLVLVGTPVSMQNTYLHIIQKSKAIYTQKKDDTNLTYIHRLENMDKTSLAYSSYCFSHAMLNRFYNVEKPSEKATALYTKIHTDSIAQIHAQKMNLLAPTGFWTNEKYTTIDLSKHLNKLVKKGTAITALYGTEDGLFSKTQVMQLQSIIGSSQLLYVENCSHNVFIDQQEVFINSLTKWLK